MTPDEITYQWLSVIEARSPKLRLHGEDVAKLSVRLARVLGLEPHLVAAIRRGALLHDVGKLAIPDEILEKPGPLTVVEQAFAQYHTVAGGKLLRTIPGFRKEVQIAELHHERWDGSGYCGLRGQEIPLHAAIVGTADCWVAMSEDRPYRTAWAQERREAFFVAAAGEQFSHTIVESLLAVVAMPQACNRIAFQTHAPSSVLA